MEKSNYFDVLKNYFFKLVNLNFEVKKFVVERFFVYKHFLRSLWWCSTDFKWSWKKAKPKQADVLKSWKNFFSEEFVPPGCFWSILRLFWYFEPKFDDFWTLLRSFWLFCLLKKDFFLSSIMVVSVFMVAEKPSLAQSIAQILSCMLLTFNIYYNHFHYF